MARSIMRKLINQDPSNSGWQHDLSDAHQGLGVLSKKQGDITSARQNFQASLEIWTSLIRLHGESHVGNRPRFGEEGAGRIVRMPIKGRTQERGFYARQASILLGSKACRSGHDRLHTVRVFFALSRGRSGI